MCSATPRAGFSLITTMIAVVIFTMLGVAAYNLEVASTKALRVYREKEDVAALADQYIEIARNLPYSEVGTLSGNPHGVLPDQPNELNLTYDGTKYQLYYIVTYVNDPAASTTDSGDEDYKQVKIYIQNPTDGLVVPFETNVVPLGIGGVSGGALSLQVINADGQPVPDATLTITDPSTSPSLNVTRTTNSQGDWIEVGLQNSANSYHIVATKSGYSTDQTYASSQSNPNPVKPNATIAGGQVTAVSFAIDQESSLTVNTVNQTCQALSGVGVQLQGTKLIGTSPNVYKFSNSYTSNSSGQVALNPIEWDTYTPSITTSSYMIYGSSPIQQIDLLPGTAQQSTLVLGPSTANSLLVIVKDSSTGNPIQGASVQLESTSPSYNQTLLTAGSILYQNNWSGGAGQYDFSTTTEYYADNGNIDTQTLPTGVRLKQIAGSYAPSGTLTSSSFDTGTASSSYTTLFWNPTSQNASTSVEFQVATNNDDLTWNFVGPDGTASTYYTTPGTTINAAQSNNRYLRYQMYLTTTSTSTTPVVSNVTINYVSGCASPGQAMFAGLSSGSNYEIVVSAPGYQTQTITGVNISGYNSLQVQLAE
jgi:hypothetical protein